LEAERAPGRHPQVAQAQLFINEVEVVVQSFALGSFDKGLARSLIMPRLVGFTLFHSRQDVHQPWMVAAALYDLVDAVFLAEAFAFGDEFDFQIVCLSCSLSRSNFVGILHLQT
jgi:hypothetical protein